MEMKVIFQHWKSKQYTSPETGELCYFFQSRHKSGCDQLPAFHQLLFKGGLWRKKKMLWREKVFYPTRNEACFQIKKY
jgi:hypothetical protein